MVNQAPAQVDKVVYMYNIYHILLTITLFKIHNESLQFYYTLGIPWNIEFSVLITLTHYSIFLCDFYFFIDFTCTPPGSHPIDCLSLHCEDWQVIDVCSRGTDLSIWSSGESWWHAEYFPWSFKHFNHDPCLNSGAYGTVYKARDTLSDTIVAIKKVTC